MFSIKKIYVVLLACIFNTCFRQENFLVEASFIIDVNPEIGYFNRLWKVWHIQNYSVFDWGNSNCMWRGKVNDRRHV